MDKLEEALNAQILSIRDDHRDVCTGKAQPSRPRTSVMKDAALRESDESEDEEDDEDWTDEEVEVKEAADHEPPLPNEDDEEDGEDDDGDDLHDVHPTDLSHLSASSISAGAVNAADARYAEDERGDDAAADGGVQEMTDEEYARALQAEEEDLYALEEDAMAEEDGG